MEDRGKCGRGKRGEARSAVCDCRRKVPILMVCGCVVVELDGEGAQGKAQLKERVISYRFIQLCCKGDPLRVS